MYLVSGSKKYAAKNGPIMKAKPLKLLDLLINVLLEVPVNKMIAVWIALISLTAVLAKFHLILTNFRETNFRLQTYTEIILYNRFYATKVQF